MTDDIKSPLLTRSELAVRQHAISFIDINKKYGLAQESRAQILRYLNGSNHTEAVINSDIGPFIGIDRIDEKLDEIKGKLNNSNIPLEDIVKELQSFHSRPRRGELIDRG